MARTTRRNTMIDLARFLDDAERIQKKVQELYPDMRKVPVEARDAIKNGKASIAEMVRALETMMSQEIERHQVVLDDEAEAPKPAAKK